MFIKLMENNEFYCDKCKSQLSNQQNYNRHIKSKGHLGIKKIIPLRVKKIVEPKIKKEKKKREKKVYYCEIHDKYFKCHSNLRDHLNSKKHNIVNQEQTEQKVDQGLVDYIKFFEGN